MSMIYRYRLYILHMYVHSPLLVFIKKFCFPAQNVFILHPYIYIFIYRKTEGEREREIIYIYRIDLKYSSLEIECKFIQLFTLFTLPCAILFEYYTSLPLQVSHDDMVYNLVICVYINGL